MGCCCCITALSTASQAFAAAETAAAATTTRGGWPGAARSDAVQGACCIAGNRAPATATAAAAGLSHGCKLLEVGSSQLACLPILAAGMSQQYPTPIARACSNDMCVHPLCFMVLAADVAQQMS